MHLSRMVVLALAIASVACGGSGGTGNGSSGSGSSSGGGSSTGGSSSGTSGSSTGGSNSGSSGGSSTSSSGGSSSSGGPDAGVSNQSITLTMGPFTVPASSEVFKCQNFANPFGGMDTDIKEYDEHMTNGSHHMFAFFAPGATDGPVQDCPSGGFEFHPYPFSAQSPDATLTYPPTVGSRVPGSMGFMLNAHFLNVGSTDFQATLTVTFHVALPGAVTQYAGVMFMDNIGIAIPPTQMPVTSTRTCSIPQDMNVMASASHMHTRATNFVATSGSQTLYSTTLWSNPVPSWYDPPIHLTSGSQVTWGCTYVNDTTSTLTFGESALDNVMCIYSMQFYPIADPSNPTIVCQQP